jgi:hypothetical protein
VLEETSQALVDKVCFGECYNPTDRRHLITRIEVVKITPQITENESLDLLIQDPFLVLDCDPLDPEGCTHTFTDPDYVTDGRPAAYYVRAIQEPTPQYNADTLRCTFDGQGNCIAVNPCNNGYDGIDDHCLADDEERAWSSPVYLKHQ